MEVPGLWLNGPALAHIRGPTSARLGTIPDGTAGAIATMKYMRQVVRDAIVDPAQRVRELALSIVGRASYTDQARLLQQWVQGNIRYIHDPPDHELIQTPQYTLQQRAGDCDDQAILLAALLTSLGHPLSDADYAGIKSHPARFIAVGLSGAPLSHVLVQTKVGPRWLGAETIIPRPLGWMPPGITSHYIVKV